jgi:hypothetical protein
VNVVNSSESGIANGDDVEQLEKPIQSREQSENVTTTTNCNDVMINLRPCHTQPCIDATAEGKDCRHLTLLPRRLASCAVTPRNDGYITSVNGQALCADGIERQIKVPAYAVTPQVVQIKDRPFEMMDIAPDEMSDGYLDHGLMEDDHASHQYFPGQQVFRVDDEVFRVTPGNSSIPSPPYEKCIM